MKRNQILALAIALTLLPGLALGEGPRFLTGPQGGDALDIALEYIKANTSEFGLTRADLADLEVSDRYTSRHNGVTHIYLQQRLDGIEVFNGLINVNVTSDGRIINVGNEFVSGLAGRVNVRDAELSGRTAIERAAADVGLDPSKADLVLVRPSGGPDQRGAFSSTSLSQDEIPVRLVYQRLDDGTVRLAWETVLNLVDGTDWWNVRVDAVSGEVLSKNNWTHDDSYLVLPFPPFENPDDSGGQSTVTDPADGIASPFGWHDTDGVVGAEFTDTQGNNVDAHDDLDGSNRPGIRPDGGATLDFAEVWNPALPPQGGTNLEAAIVNLFYANNVMHDLTYQYGFDEPSGNFQSNNYGNGGLGNDEVLADAQDGSGFNNATFGTPPDGFSPRMTMFIWLLSPNGTLTINSPAGIAGDYGAQSGGWGGALTPTTTANIELVNDGSALPSEGCGPLVGFTPGNIALIDRGTCEFGTKALNAENAGAVAAIIANNDTVNADSIISMGAGADGGSVTIPAVMISFNDGTVIKGVLPAAVNGTIGENSGVDRDSDMDNGIIAHEYGHGISNRLTGGPANVGCLGGSEQAGEGWSDFWTLVLTAKPGDTATQPRGIGNYVIFEPATGPGIRNFPYSTDLGVNPQTYEDIGSTNVPHGVGEIWMSMVWEVYWELVDKHGFDSDLYFGTGGNNLTIQLVVDGMKLQNCTPTFVDARDAILLADMTNNGGANECEIWRGFAKRGLGVSAIDGSANAGDETEAFDIPVQCENTAPMVEITAPPNLSMFDENDTITFTGTATDTEDGDLTASLGWSSDLDGALGTGGSVMTMLSVGTHTITAEVTDSGGLSDSDTRQVIVEADPPPTVTITAPAELAMFDVADTISFTGTATDHEEGDLSANIDWSSDVDGPLGTGATVMSMLTAGFHTITAEVTNLDGLSGSATRQVVVEDPPGCMTDLVISGQVIGGPNSFFAAKSVMIDTSTFDGTSVSTVEAGYMVEIGNDVEIGGEFSIELTATPCP